MTQTAIAPEVRELAAKAAGIIRALGWHQGDFSSGPRRGAWEGEPVCIAGACNVALHGNPFIIAEPRHQVDLYRTIERITGGGSASAWNDAEGRAVEDVLALLDSIASGA